MSIELPEFIGPDLANVLRSHPHPLHVEDIVTVWWSNGAGFSLYRVLDGETAHVFQHMADYDVCSEGGYKRIHA